MVGSYRRANMMRMTPTLTSPSDPSWIIANSMKQPPWVAIIATVSGACLQSRLTISRFFRRQRVRYYLNPESPERRLPFPKSHHG